VREAFGVRRLVGAFEQSSAFESGSKLSHSKRYREVRNTSASILPNLPDGGWFPHEI
jgi:hypothetical protein